MDTQFNNLEIPDTDTEYYYTNSSKAKGFTHLMSLVFVENNTEAIEIIKHILKTSPDELNKQNSKGFTALMLACLYTNADAIKLLLDAGCDTNLSDNCGNTALMYMLHNPNPDKTILTHLIINSQSSITYYNSYGQSAYILYKRTRLNILDGYFLNILKGTVCVNSTKSAKNLV